MNVEKQGFSNFPFGRKKFVEILPHYPGACTNQISEKENYVRYPIKIMRKKGYDAEILTLWKKGLKKEEIVTGVKIRRFRNTLSLLLHLFFDRNIKLVYAQSRPYPPSLLSPLSLKKCVLMTQTYELGSNWLIKKFSLFFMNKFTKIFTLTPYERQEYIKNGLRKDRVLFSPHAIDYSFFSKKPKSDLDKIRKRYGIHKDDFVITTVANFRKFKNLDIMVSAFALFNKKIKKSKILIVGKDLTEDQFYKEQDSGRYGEVGDVGEIVKREEISKNVVFTGGLNYKKVREILYISDVFVNSSDPEGMGMAVYEAASSGVPLCLSNIGSFTSVFKDKALYNPPRDAKKLADNYMEYYKNKSLRKKNSLVLKNLMKKWDYRIAIRRFNQIFDELLMKNSNRKG